MQQRNLYNTLLILCTKLALVLLLSSLTYAQQPPQQPENSLRRGFTRLDALRNNIVIGASQAFSSLPSAVSSDVNIGDITFTANWITGDRITVNDASKFYFHDGTQWVTFTRGDLFNLNVSYFKSEHHGTPTFAYLIGDGTRSEIAISNPFPNNRDILVQIREATPPYNHVSGMVDLASAEKINFTFTGVPDLNQYAAFVILAATSQPITSHPAPSFQHAFRNNKLIRQVWENLGDYRLVSADNSATDEIIGVTFGEDNLSAFDENYVIKIAHTYNYWDFPDTSYSEVEHSLNERNLVFTVNDKETGVEVSADIEHEHQNSLIGRFPTPPDTAEYEMFALPVFAPFSEFNGTVNAASDLIFVDGEFIGAQ